MWKNVRSVISILAMIERCYLMRANSSFWLPSPSLAFTNTTFASCKHLLRRLVDAFVASDKTRDNVIPRSHFEMDAARNESARSISRSGICAVKSRNYGIINSIVLRETGSNGRHLNRMNKTCVIAYAEVIPSYVCELAIVFADASPRQYSTAIAYPTVLLLSSKRGISLIRRRYNNWKKMKNFEDLINTIDRSINIRNFIPRKFDSRHLGIHYLSISSIIQASRARNKYPRNPRHRRSSCLVRSHRIGPRARQLLSRRR